MSLGCPQRSPPGRLLQEIDRGWATVEGEESLDDRYKRLREEFEVQS